MGVAEGMLTVRLCLHFYPFQGLGFINCYKRFIRFLIYPFGSLYGIIKMLMFCLHGYYEYYTSSGSSGKTEVINLGINKAYKE